MRKHSFTVKEIEGGKGMSGDYHATKPGQPDLRLLATTEAEAAKQSKLLVVNIVYKLWQEANELTKPFAHIKFTSYPEFKHAEGSFYIIEKKHSKRNFLSSKKFLTEITKNEVTRFVKDGVGYTPLSFCKEKYEKYMDIFFKETDKIMKTGKSILTLKMLSYVFEWNHDKFITGKKFYGIQDVTCKRYETQFVTLFMEAFIQLERYDILVKYYEEDPALNHNLEFLQHIVSYYISNKDAANASAILEKLRALEPSHPFVAHSLQRIKTISMIKRLGDSNIDMEKMNALSGQDFESLLIQQFIKIGFTAQGTPGSGDFGADILVDTEDGTRFVIQCKRFKSKVNLKAVQEVVGAMPHYNGDIGIVITSNGFLPSAATLAESNGIELWGNMELMNFLSGDLSFSQLAEWKK